MKSVSIAKNVARNWQIAVIALLAVALVGVTVWAVTERNFNATHQYWGANNSGNANVDTEAALEEHGITPLTQEQASNSTDTAKKLAFIIEEEKLAHDVYVALYDKWGARVFDNIKNSETTHQNLVLAVMTSRGLSDPRQSTMGKFTDQDLQKLYDQLVAQGSQSALEAYKVGVAIEEKDIADIKDIVASLDAKDTDIKDVLENLSNGSENHLRAFTRQVAR